MAVQTTYKERDLLEDVLQKRRTGRTLRQIAQLYKGITHGDIARILRGCFPKSKMKREALGLPEYAQVVVVAGGEVPPGTQVVTATLCACGQWYISNHPRRRKCFQCSPFRSAHRYKNGAM